VCGERLPPFEAEPLSLSDTLFQMTRLGLFAVVGTALVLGGASAVLLRGGCAELVRIPGGPPPRVDATVPLALAAAREKLELISREPTALGFPGIFTWVRADDNAFPDDFQIRAFSSRDPLLRKYLSRPTLQRTGSFYLRQDLESYWSSEYQCSGQPVKFRSNFIVDLIPESPASTRVEILEYQPTVLVGRKFAITAHGGPGLYDDIRHVEPTTSDRIEILRRVLAMLREP
jgi:hypothetical protein